MAATLRQNSDGPGREQHKDKAMKANLRQAAIQIIVGAMLSHQSLVTKLLSDETTRGLFLDVAYELLTRDGDWDLMQTAR